jgi:hypothetical protein
VSAWEAARDEAKAADRRYAEMQRGGARGQAEARDVQLLADAIRDDKAAPEPHFAAEFEATLATAKREQQARVLVERARWEAVAAAFEKHGTELSERAGRAFETARKGCLRALSTLQQAHAKLETSKGLQAFATASVDGVYRPGAFLSTAEVPLPPPDPDSGGTRVTAVLTALELCGSDRPLHPPGVNPDALRSEHGHVPPHLQGRTRSVVPAGGPAGG